MITKKLRFQVGAVGQLFLLLTLSFCGALHAQEFYRWVDDKGIIHFTDSLHLVPEKYRGQAEKRWLAPSLELPEPAPQSELKRSDEPASQKSRIPFVRRGKEILLEGFINQRGPVQLIVDRDALITTVPASIASQLGINLENALPLPIVASNGAVSESWRGVVQGILGVRSRRWLAIDNSLRVGNVEVDDLEIEISDGGPSEFGLLGMDFLGRFRIHIDHGSSQMEVIREERPYDGLSPEWWQEKFRLYRSLKRTYEQRIKSSREYYDKIRDWGLNVPDIVNLAESLQQIENNIRTYAGYLRIVTQKLTDLDRRASDVALPRNLRE